jgi:hypothetical protein
VPPHLGWEAFGQIGRLQAIDGPRKGPLEREANRDPGEIRGVEIKRSDKAADHGRDYDGQAPPDMVANEAPKPHGEEDDAVVQDLGRATEIATVMAFPSPNMRMGSVQARLLGKLVMTSTTTFVQIERPMGRRRTARSC